jgi:hypothetical protein
MKEAAENRLALSFEASFFISGNPTGRYIYAIIYSVIKKPRTPIVYAGLSEVFHSWPSNSTLKQLSKYSEPMDSDDRLKSELPGMEQPICGPMLPATRIALVRCLGAETKGF